MPHGRDRSPCPPPWWSESHNGPRPDGTHHRWRKGRARFARRFAAVFALMFIVFATGVVTIVSMVMTALFRSSPSTPSPGFPFSAWSWPQTGAVASILALAVIAGFAAVMRRVGLPLGDIVSAADRVRDGDYSARVTEHGPPSLRSVARAFNSMAARLQAEDEQRRHLMADIAHELRTPLAVMQGQLEGLLDGIYDRTDERLTEVLNQTRLLARLVEDLRTLAQADRGTLGLKKEPTDLVALANDAVASFTADARARQVAIDVVERGEVPSVDVDPVRIREVLSNLISNALRHSAAGSRVTVSVESRHDAVTITVRDAGAGIPPEMLLRIFDRFYKGPASPGSGLGLTIARNLVEAHGGHIQADSRVGEGATFTVTLPRPTDRAA